jgi:hypothetical protein
MLLRFHLSVFLTIHYYKFGIVYFVNFSLRNCVCDFPEDEIFRIDPKDQSFSREFLEARFVFSSFHSIG